jgi:hypothetical protein
MAGRARSDPRSQLQQFALALGIVFLLGGLSTLAYQFFWWLEYSAWLPLPTSVVLDSVDVARPSTDWPVLETVINWMLDRLPVWGALFLLSALFFGLS